MDYQALIQELYGLERFGIKLGLETVRDLLKRIGNPHERFATIHVTGTNGKGSTCAFLSSIARAAGHRVGLYTSPHLVKFNERIRVDGEMIADADVARMYEDIRPHAAAMAAKSSTDQPTFFEVTTAMAFRYFEERRVDLAIVEVGMGGRLDATNVITPEVSVLTRIGLEHTEHLGRTVERIAKEKSGIIKPGIPVATVEQQALAVIAAKAEAMRCPLTVVGRDVRYERKRFDLEGQSLLLHDGFSIEARIPLLGAFQPENAALAFATALAADPKWGFTETAIAKGLSAARWPGRLQVVRRDPTIIVDGAHNAPAAEALAESLRELFPAKRVTFVIGVLNDKDLAGMVGALGPLASRVIATKPKTPRAFDPEAISRAFRAHASVDAVPDVKEALAAAMRSIGREDVLVVTGSIYTVGEALEILGGWE